MRVRLGTKEKPLQGSVLVESLVNGSPFFTHEDAGGVFDLPDQVESCTFSPDPGGSFAYGPLWKGNYVQFTVGNPQTLKSLKSFDVKIKLVNGVVETLECFVAPASAEKVQYIADTMNVAVVEPDWDAGEYGQWHEASNVPKPDKAEDLVRQLAEAYEVTK